MIHDDYHYRQAGVYHSLLRGSTPNHYHRCPKCGIYFVDEDIDNKLFSKEEEHCHRLIGQEEILALALRGALRNDKVCCIRCFNEA